MSTGSAISLDDLDQLVLNATMARQAYKDADWTHMAEMVHAVGRIARKLTEARVA